MTGSFAVDANDLTSEEVVASLEAVLAEELGVHPQDVEVVFDSDTGIATYVITSEDAETLLSLQAVLEEDTTVEQIDSSLGDFITVTGHAAPEQVEFTIDFVVDATAVEDPETAITFVEDHLEETDYEYSSESNLFRWLHVS